MREPTIKTYSIGDAADLLGVHHTTLRRAISSGDLKAAQLGRAWRISRQDLSDYYKRSGGGVLVDTGAAILAEIMDHETGEKLGVAHVHLEGYRHAAQWPQGTIKANDILKPGDIHRLGIDPDTIIWIQES